MSSPSLPLQRPSTQARPTTGLCRNAIRGYQLGTFKYLLEQTLSGTTCPLLLGDIHARLLHVEAAFTVRHRGDGGGGGGGGGAVTTLRREGKPYSKHIME